MTVKNLLIDLLLQLKDVTEKLNDSEFSKPLSILSDSSIGQHIRHAIEFVLAVEKGAKKGEISYDNRERDVNIQQFTEIASIKIDELIIYLKNCNCNKVLKLHSEFPQSEISNSVETNLEREILYNIEHIVHHMAFIKIGIQVSFQKITLPECFGIAQSTIAFQNEAS